MDGSRDSENENAGNQATTDSTNIIMPKEESRDEKPPLESAPSRSVHSGASTATVTSISTEPNNDSECTQLKGGERQEKWWTTTLQISIPFLLAGIGTIGAGLTLSYVRNWKVVKEVQVLLILMPPLLGFIGNLDMCLASRLSTQANLGNMSSWKEIWKMVVGNIAMVQVQAIVTSLLASVFAVIMNLILNKNFEMKHVFLLTASSVTTATSASFFLGLVLIATVVISYRVKWNPDNLATSAAACLGDIVAIILLVCIASGFYEIPDLYFWILIIVSLVNLLVFLPLWIIIVLRNKYTRPILKCGWAPMLTGLIISGVGCLVLDTVKYEYKAYPVFQPIITNIGGNLVAIQASRISTMLHQTSQPGILPPHTVVYAIPFVTPIKGLPHAATARLLFCMNIVGQMVFAFAADYIFNEKFTITLAFATSYLFVTVLHVMILLYIAHVLIHTLWKRKIDPDNSSIPLLSALGDVLCSGLLALVFFFLDGINLPYGK